MDSVAVTDEQQQQQQQQQDATAATSQGSFQQGPLPEGLNLDACFGKVIRKMQAGESFGELALLHKGALRTATVVTCAQDAQDSAEAGSSPHPGMGLIRISRQDYDRTVSQLCFGLRVLASLLGINPWCINLSWAAWYNTWLLVKLTPKDEVFSFLFINLKDAFWASLLLCHSWTHNPFYG